MATFQITGPDGKKYRVSGESADGAMKALKSMQGTQAALPPGGGDVAMPHAPQKAALDHTSGHVMESREPGMMESIGNWLKDNSGLPIDRYRRDAQTVDDAARSFANKATFNQADRLAAKAEGTTPQQQWDRSEFAEQRSPGVSDLAGIAGAVATPLAAGKAGLTLMRPGLAAAKGTMPAMARALLMGAEGGAYGSASALGEGEDPMMGALTGAGFGAGGQMLGETVGKALSASPKATQSIDELRSAKTAAYKAVDDSGFRFTPQQFGDMVTDTFHTARDKNVSLIRHPQTADMLKRMAGFAQKGPTPTLTEMDQLRQVVWRDLGNSTDPAEKEFGRMIVDKIDNMIDGTEGASDVVKNARELNRRYKNAERFDEAMVKADRRAASTNSGGNLENAQRQNARQILDNPRKAKFLNAEEKAGMETMVRGTAGQNAARKTGKFLHSIPGVGALMGGGGLMAAADMAGTGGALTLAALLAGAGAKGISRSAGNANKALVEALIREGKAPAAKGMSPEQIQMLSRLLLGGSSGVGAGM